MPDDHLPTHAQSTPPAEHSEVRCPGCKSILGWRQVNLFLAEVGTQILMKISHVYVVEIEGLVGDVAYKREQWFNVERRTTYSFDRTHPLKCGCGMFTKFYVTR